MKNKAARVIFTIIAILLMVGIIGLYVYEVFFQNKPPQENLVRTFVVVAGAIGTIVKVHSGRTRRRSLRFYEKFYEQELGRAFDGDPKRRKKLLEACRTYNEGNYDAALKLLGQLQKGDLQRKDLVPVLLFTAICYDDAGLPREAIRVYEQILAYDPCNSTAYGNLGLLYRKNGQTEKALQQFCRAIDYDRENYYAYNNRAHTYFDMDRYDLAIADARSALEIKSNGREAAGLLAIIYALLDDEENKKKYYQLALKAGQTPERLNHAIAYYLRQRDAELDEED